MRLAGWEKVATWLHAREARSTLPAVMSAGKKIICSMHRAACKRALAPHLHKAWRFFGCGHKHAACCIAPGQQVS